MQVCTGNVTEHFVVSDENSTDLADLLPLVDEEVLEACQGPDWGDGGQDVNPRRPLDVRVPDHVGGGHVVADPVHHLLLQLLGKGAREFAVVPVVALYHEQVLQVRHVLLLPLPPPGHRQVVLGVVVGDEGRPHSVEHGRGQLAEHLGGEGGILGHISLFRRVVACRG